MINSILDLLTEEDLEVLKDRSNICSDKEIKDLETEFNTHIITVLSHSNITQDDWNKLEEHWYRELDNDIDRDYKGILEEMEIQMKQGVETLEFDSLSDS